MTMPLPVSVTTPWSQGGQHSFCRLPRKIRSTSEPLQTLQGFAPNAPYIEPKHKLLRKLSSLQLQIFVNGSHLTALVYQEFSGTPR